MFSEVFTGPYKQGSTRLIWFYKVLNVKSVLAVQGLSFTGSSGCIRILSGFYQDIGLGFRAYG